MTGLEYIDVTPGGLGIPFIYSYLYRSGDSLLVVETGPQSMVDVLAGELKKRVREGVRRLHVFVTHIHLDHGGGVGGLLESLEGLNVEAKVYVHPRGVKHLVDPSKLWEASKQALGWLAEVYGKPVPAPKDKLVATSDGMVVEVGGAKAIVVHTPGHASHHQSLLLETKGERILFTGDSMGLYAPEVNATVPTTPPPFRYELYLESIRKQSRLRPTRLAFTHRGVGGPELIERHEAQTMMWRDIILEELKHGTRSPEKILERLRTEDPWV
ncbi:MAG: MBL fold metallo-hydrolase, partial [Pyrodictiaceae archaeon]